MTQEQLKADIAAAIYTNINGDIDGDELRDLMIEMVGNSGSNPITNDSPITAPVTIAGGGTIALVNGSGAVTGTGTTFTDNTGAGLSYTQRFYLFTPSTVFRVYVNVTDNTNATITGHYDLFVDPEEQADLGTLWTDASVSGKTVYSHANVISGDFLMGAIIGLNNVVVNSPQSEEVLIFGHANIVVNTAPRVFLSGSYNTVKNCSSAAYIIGSVNIIENCTAIASIIGSTGQVISGATFVYNLVYLDEFPNNAAALAGGLTIGVMYKTATGEVRVVV